MTTEVIEPAIIEKPDIGTISDISEKIGNAFAKWWSVIVWNDDVHSYEYVIAVLMRVTGCTAEQGFKHADTIHHLGKSIVAQETQEKAELYYEQLIELELSATIERNS